MISRLYYTNYCTRSIPLTSAGYIHIFQLASVVTLDTSTLPTPSRNTDTVVRTPSTHYTALRRGDQVHPYWTRVCCRIKIKLIHLLCVALLSAELRKGEYLIIRLAEMVIMMKYFSILLLPFPYLTSLHHLTSMALL